MDRLNKLPNTLNSLRASFHSKKIDGYLSVVQLFHVSSTQASDFDRSTSLNRRQFQAFLSSAGLFLSSQDQSDLFRYFDQDCDSEISLRELQQGILASLSSNRLNLVQQAFRNLDQYGRGSLSHQFLQDFFSANTHPRVLSREKSTVQVSQEWQNIKLYGNPVTLEGFIAFYTMLNSTVPLEKQRYFQGLTRAWTGIRDSQVSEQRLVELQNIIFEKIRQRCIENDDEGKTLNRHFRYFDTDQSNSLSFNEFKLALQRISCYFTNQELRGLFYKFDTDNSGSLAYQEFSAIFARKGASGPHFFPSKSAFPQQVLEKVRSELLRRGASGIRGLGVVFRRMDNNRNRNLDRAEFDQGLRENGHRLTPIQLDKLFQYFDRNKDGKVSYDQFLRAIRGELNKRRQNLVDLAYQKLDKNRDGTVNLEDMRLAYDVSFHPDFQAGRKTKDQVLEEFMAQWDTLERDNVITQEEFRDYFKDISASIDTDDEFELMIRNAWHIAGGEGQYENTTIPRYLQENPDGSQQVVMAKGHEDFRYEQGLKRNWGN